MAKEVGVFKGGSRNGEDGKRSERRPNVTLLVVGKTLFDIFEKPEQSVLRLHLK